MATFSAALPSFLDEFTKFYKPAPGTDLFNAKCVTCHGIEGHTVKNYYGKEVMGLIQSSGGLTLTDDMLISLENRDADGDGYTNIEEIVSGKLPGDPASHPLSHPDPKTLPKRPVHLPLVQMASGCVAVVALVGGWGLIARNRKHQVNTKSENEVGS